ncbi:uncharacterized protein [Solanum tuberosum]|uniref:uncharacterized protein n=1 Tax=Solanum tuberosum TaxID=4113 RepID=UPI00073A0039|nr:PREDICTED: uncharacterized protein LOC102599220 [Solanum tuberosum]
MTGVLILLSVLLLAAGTLPEPPELPPTSPESLSTTISCVDELVAFSPCLPYISDPPNNISDSPPFQCCDNFSAAFVDDTAICLCYLVRNPQLLGFPISSMKLLSLTSMCPVEEKEGAENLSLESLCSGSTTLPPFRSITDHRGSSPRPVRPTPPSSPRPPSTPNPGKLLTFCFFKLITLTFQLFPSILMNTLLPLNIYISYITFIKVIIKVT